MTRRPFVEVPTIKIYYAENRERILTRKKQWRTQNAGILKTRRKRVVDPESFKSYPYGYAGLYDTDIENIGNLFALEVIKKTF